MSTIPARPIAGPMPLTDEWHEARSKPTVFGASAAHDLVTHPLRIYMRKCHETEESETTQMQAGRYFETGILRWYEEATDSHLIRPCPMFYHAANRHLAATPDALDPRQDGSPVEAKWSLSPTVLRELGEEGSDYVPDRWLWQVQQQMDVLQVDRADIAAVVFGKLRVFHVQRNDVLVEAIHKAAAELAQRIVNRDPPEPNWEHPDEPKLLKELYGLASGEIVELDEEAVGLRDALEWARVRKREAEKDIRALETRQLALMGDASIGRLPNGRELYRVQVAGGPVSYERKPYWYLKERKRSDS